MTAAADRRRPTEFVLHVLPVQSSSVFTGNTDWQNDFILFRPYLYLLVNCEFILLYNPDYGSGGDLFG